MAQQRKTILDSKRNPVSIAFLGGTLLALAACTGAPAPSPAARASAPAQSPVLAQNIAGPPAASGPAVARLPSPRTLKGLKPEEVVSLMGGPPDLRRLDPPAQLWQYRTSDCILDVFFYNEDDGYRVSVAGTRSRNPGQGARCAAAGATVSLR